MDPLGSLLNIYQVVQMIYDAVQLVISNEEQCKRIEQRVGMIITMLQSYFPAPDIDPTQSASLTSLSQVANQSGPKAQMQRVSQLAVQFSPASAAMVQQKVAQHQEPEALASCLAHLTTVLNNVLRIINSFHGGMTGKNFQQMLIARIKRAALMNYYQGEFADASEEINQALQLLQTVLQLDVRADVKNIAQWRQQDKEDAEADARALKVQLESLKDTTQDGFKRSDQYSQEIIDMNQQASRQLDSLNHNVKLIMQQLSFQNSPLGSAPTPPFMGGGGPGVPMMMMGAPGTPNPSMSPMASQSWTDQIDPRLATPLYRIEFEHLIGVEQAAENAIPIKIYSGRWSGHEVAIKSFEDWSYEISQQFFREVDLTAKLRSCYVTQLYAACLEQGNACFILEYMAGGTLFRRIQRDGKMDTTMAWSIAKDLASGIAYLHANDIWHLGIRSTNVLLTETGRAKLSDFGNARIVQRIDDEATPGRFRTRLNPPARLVDFARVHSSFNDIMPLLWTAPDLVVPAFGAGAESANVCAASDIYSFGVVFYEMLSGLPPYASLHQDPFRLRQVLVDCTSPSPFPCFASAHPFQTEWNVSPVCANLVVQCTSKMSGSRPAADQLLDFLNNIKLEDVLLGTAPAEPFSPWRNVYKHALQAKKQGDICGSMQLMECVVQSDHPIYGHRACTDLAMMMMSQNTDYHRALKLLRFAGERGYDRANIALCQYLLRGSSTYRTPPDRDSALAVFQLLIHSTNPSTLQAIPQLKQLLQI